jgi:Mn-dependent DtxR family transcriptional regulator
MIHKGSASIREMAEYLGISPYKVHRIMEDMSSKGLIIKRVKAETGTTNPDT